MIAQKQYLQAARKAIARLALSTSTIAVVLSVLAPVHQALAFRGTTNLKVPLTDFDNGTKYFFTFDAYNLQGANDNFSPSMLGQDDLDSKYIFSLTSWGIDFGGNGQIEGINNELFSDQFGVSDISIDQISTTNWLISQFQADGFYWDIEWGVGNGIFQDISFKRTAVGNPNTTATLLDSSSVTPRVVASTPEPTSTLALLALGGLGVASKLKTSKKES
jgi:hypothetical protein